MTLKEKELRQIYGGNINITGALLNSVSTLINTVFGVGRSLGTVIRMVTSGTRC